MCGKRGYLLPFLDEGQCMDIVIFYCHFFSFLLLLSYESKYHSCHIEARIMNAVFKVKLHKSTCKKDLKDAESFAKSCYIKNCCEKIYKFHRK